MRPFEQIMIKLEYLKHVINIEKSYYCEGVFP